MTSKDTILIAVVINAGLLAILFTTAVIYDSEKTIDHSEITSPLAQNKPAQSESSQTLIATAQTGDEVDNVLKYYSSPQAQPIVVETQTETVPEPIAIQSNAPDDEELSELDSDSSPHDHFVEVKVKKGDVLEKIAKRYKTTVVAIKRANQLQNERLSIGQVLKIPVKQESSAIAQTTSSSKQKEEKEESLPVQKQEAKKDGEGAEAVYYVVKSGDNPWKIAKKYNVRDEDILRLNQMDEEKARNLKVGDRIRVK